jgi:hypothetical protein
MSRNRAIMHVASLIKLILMLDALIGLHVEWPMDGNHIGAQDNPLNASIVVAVIGTFLDCTNQGVCPSHSQKSEFFPAKIY